MKIKCYLCVDKDGTEQVRDRKPKRFFGTKEEINKERISYDDILKKNIWISDYDHISDDEFPKFGVLTMKNILPSETIEKIIGRKLTWDDEPVELFTYNNFS